MIHICFGLHDKTGRYSKFTGTAILSLFENTKSEVTVHILHDNTLTQDNREKFSLLAERYNQLVKFYNVDKLCADKINEYVSFVPEIKNARVSVATLYDLLTIQLISTDIEKVIYLDSDIIVNLDIKEFWQIEPGDKPLAAVTELSNGINTFTHFLLCQEGIVNGKDYFNAGILMMNLKILRGEEKNIIKGLKFRGENPRYRQFDQSVLNYCFSTRALKLPTKFNRFISCARLQGEKKIEQKIYHYTGTQIGLGVGLNMRDPFNNLWMSYFIKTPWFDENAIGRFYEVVQKLHVELKQAMVQLSALMSGKERAFFVLPSDIAMIKKFFSVRDDEEIISAENQQSLQNLIDAMKFYKGKKVFFIIVANFPFNALTQAGFVYGRDFINGVELLSEANGVPMNSYPFIQAM